MPTSSNWHKIGAFVRWTTSVGNKTWSPARPATVGSWLRTISLLAIAALRVETFTCWARQCTSTRSLREGWVFGLRDAWFHVPMLLSADMITFFHQQNRSSAPSKQGNNWQHQLRLVPKTHDSLWCQLHHDQTSKEYLINCRILLKYFELIFIQLPLVKIACKLLIIIWLNYERKKRGHFFKRHRVYCLGLVTKFTFKHSIHS